tara:strand:+ start:377 stop:772 length:396 start_codon:yes stop_codon:yes gene_type:complete
MPRETASTNSEKQSLARVQNTPKNDDNCLKKESCWKCMIISCFLIIVVPITICCIYGIQYTYDNQEDCLNSSGNNEEDCNGEWYEWIIFILCIICLCVTSCTILKELGIACIDYLCCDKKSNESPQQYGQV